MNSSIHKDLVKLKKHRPTDLAWAQMFTKIDQSGVVLGIVWIDHGPVLFLTNASDPELQVKVERRQPAKTFSWALVTRALFQG